MAKTATNRGKSSLSCGDNLASIGVDELHRLCSECDRVILPVVNWAANGEPVRKVEVTVALCFTASARKLGMASAVGTALLTTVYAVTLAVGLLSLQSPQQPIGDPLFSILEILIILATPLMVALMVAIHAWGPAETKVFSLMALVFMSLLAGLTCSVHFVILTVGRQAAFSGNALMQLFLSFKWPSVSYALDILAWDVFFPLSVLFAAPVFSGNRLAMSIRVLLVASGALGLGGLSGVIVGDMQLRNIGIVGYAGVFPVVSLLLAILFHRTTPREETAARRLIA
jgi:hypothetical protein